jgi:hypothetical protein
MLPFPISPAPLVDASMSALSSNPQIFEVSTDHVFASNGITSQITP